MSSPVTLERPAASRAVVEPHPDGFTLRLPARGFRAVWQGWLVCLALISFVILVSVTGGMALARAHTVADRLGLGALLIFSGFALRPLALLLTKWLLDESLGRATVVVIGSNLYIHRQGILLGREFAWSRAQLLAIDEEAGRLVVLSDEGPEALFHGRDRDELSWAARLVRQALDLPAEPKPEPGELPVSCAMADQGVVLRGLLRVGPGRLSIRLPFSSEEPLLEFHPPGIHGRPHGLPLRPNQIEWRDTSDGSSCLVLNLEKHFGDRLLIGCDDPMTLRAGMERFWAVI